MHADHPPSEESSPLPAIAGRPVRQAALAFIFVTVMLDILALGIIIPVLTPLVLRMVGGSAESTAYYIAIFGTSWAAMQFVAGPLLGALSDRFGRRPVVLLSNFGLGLDYVVMALAPTPAWLFVGRVVSGFTSGSIPTAYAYIADVTPPEKRSQSFGMIGAAFALGFVVGPALGGALGQVDVRLPFWVAAGLSLANACYGLFVLPESLPRSRRTAFSWRRANPVAALGLLRSHRELIGLAGVILLFNLAHEVFPSVYVLYADTRFGLSDLTVGLMLGTAGVCSALVQGKLIKPVIARVGERGSILAGSVFGSVGFALYGLATQPWLFWLAVPLVSLWGLASPPTQAIMTRRVLPTEQGRLQGAVGSLRGLTGIMGPKLYTTTFTTFAAAGWAGRRGWTVPGAPFLLSSALVVMSLGAAWMVTRPRPGEQSSNGSATDGSVVPPVGAVVAGTAESAPTGFTSEVS